MEKVTGIIVSYNKYKDNDIIFNVLTENDFISFIGLGSSKTTSKTFNLLKPFIYGEFELYKGPTLHYKVKDSKILNNYSLKFKQYDDVIILDFLVELTFKFLIENNDYTKYLDLLKSVLDNYDSNSKVKYSLIIYYFAQLIKLNGGAFNLSSCIHCNNNSNLEYIDYFAGGLLCNNHLNDYSIYISKEDITLLNNLFNGEISDILKTYINKEKFIELVNNLAIFINKSYEINLNSINLVKTI